MIVLDHTNPPTIYLDYHWWATWTTDQYGPILRVGGAEVSIEGGQFVAMHSRIDMSYPTLGSPLTKNKSTFSDYHSDLNFMLGGDVHTVIVGQAEDKSHTRPDNVFPSPGIFYDEVFNDYIHIGICSRLSKNLVLHTNYFSDYHYWSTIDVDLAYCGNSFISTQCGIFACDISPLNDISYRFHWGSRLSKNLVEVPWFSALPINLSFQNLY